MSSTIPYVLLALSAGPACSIGKAVTRNQNAGAAQWSKPPTVDRSSLQRQQFGERLRIAERIVQVLCEGCRLMGPLLQIAAIGVGSRFGGTADVHSGQSPFKPPAGFHLKPSARVFRYKKKVRPAADVG